jgi:hypothetical protein
MVADFKPSTCAGELGRIYPRSTTMKIYLDIDGVILKKDLTMPDYGNEFISFLVTNHDCYWLTTHCRGGNNNAINHLSKCYPLSTLELLKMIKQTDWTDLKTEAIDLNSHFIWLEDYPFESEKVVLNKVNKIDSLKKIEMITIKLNINSTKQRG